MAGACRRCNSRLPTRAPPRTADWRRALPAIPTAARGASPTAPSSRWPAVPERSPTTAAVPASSADRLLVDDRLAFFDERFVGAALSGTASAGAAETGEQGDAPFPYSLDLPEKGTQPSTSRSAPKPAPSSPLASAAKKRLHIADASPDANSLQADSHTAIYDIAARTVYLPNGRRLEAHSGLGDLMDDPRYINVKARANAAECL
jgi:hypothetical protein